MSRPRLLDLFCGAGGAAVGYEQAGFEVVGVDIRDQPNYPYEFHRVDAMDTLRALSELRRVGGRPPLDFDAIHASPPCQAYTKAQRLRGIKHPDLIAPVREQLRAIGLPYIIENVPGAPLLNPMVLCGLMFGLDVDRDRLFETSFDVVWPPHPGEIIQVVGHFSDVAYARSAMGIGWMTRDELREAVPPAFTEFLGRQLLAVLESAA